MTTKGKGLTLIRSFKQDINLLFFSALQLFQIRLTQN
jgi:hypothetical protein